MRRIVDWPARFAFSGGAATLLILFLRIPFPRTFDAIRIYDSVRTGATAAVVVGGAMLTLSWAQRRYREWGRSQEKRRAIRLATLMAHADPLTAQVDGHEREMSEIRDEVRTVGLQVRSLMATFADELDAHGRGSDNLQDTRPVLWLLPPLDDEKKDSA
jgi:hypothetical protein